MVFALKPIRFGSASHCHHFLPGFSIGQKFDVAEMLSWEEAKALIEKNGQTSSYHWWEHPDQLPGGTALELLAMWMGVKNEHGYHDAYITYAYFRELSC